jgi:hypothetical protein
LFNAWDRIFPVFCTFFATPSKIAIGAVDEVSDHQKKVGGK